MPRLRTNPWPEEVLIGLQHGVIPLLPPEFRPMFGAAALYAQPARFAETVIDLFAEPEFQEDLRKAGKEFRETVLSGTEALARVEALIGPPEPTAPVASPSLRPKGRILSLSTNGVGMGHLSRQMAIARRQRPGLETVFLSFSQSVHVVRRFGWIGEYLPYHVDIDLNRTHWNAWLLTALEGAISFYDARALVLDANVPFRGAGGPARKTSGVPDDLGPPRYVGRGAGSDRPRPGKSFRRRDRTGRDSGHLRHRTDDNPTGYRTVCGPDYVS